MNKYLLYFVWTLLFAIVLGMLTKLAIDGVILALIALVVLGTLLLVGFGVGITLVAVFIAAKREQAHFTANVKENLSIIQAMQRVMNAQNSQLLSQAHKTRRLPGLLPDAVDLVEIDESIFDVLDD